MVGTAQDNYHYECAREDCGGSYDSPLPVVDVWCPECDVDGTMRAMKLVEEGERDCPTCGESKPAAEFYRGKKDCKKCYREKYPR